MPLTPGGTRTEPATTASSLSFSPSGRSLNCTRRLAPARRVLIGVVSNTEAASNPPFTQVPTRRSSSSSTSSPPIPWANVGQAPSRTRPPAAAPTWTDSEQRGRCRANSPVPALESMNVDALLLDDVPPSKPRLISSQSLPVGTPQLRGITVDGAFNGHAGDRKAGLRDGAALSQ
jgi:hypothetical protein